MQLTNQQIKFVQKRRAELEREELEILRMPDRVRYAPDSNTTSRLFSIYDEQRFLNFMIKMHEAGKVLPDNG